MPTWKRRRREEGAFSLSQLSILSFFPSTDSERRYGGRGKMRDREGKKEYTVGASKGKKKKLKEETSRKQHSN